MLLVAQHEICACCREPSHKGVDQQCSNVHSVQRQPHLPASRHSYFNSQFASTVCWITAPTPQRRRFGWRVCGVPVTAQRHTTIHVQKRNCSAHVERIWVRDSAALSSRL